MGWGAERSAQVQSNSTEGIGIVDLFIEIVFLSTYALVPLLGSINEQVVTWRFEESDVVFAGNVAYF